MPRIRDLGINAIPTTKWPSRAGIWACGNTDDPGCGHTDNEPCEPVSCGTTRRGGGECDLPSCGHTDRPGCSPPSCGNSNKPPKANAGGLSPANAMQLKQQLQHRMFTNT